MPNSNDCYIIKGANDDKTACLYCQYPHLRIFEENLHDLDIMVDIDSNRIRLYDGLNLASAHSIAKQINFCPFCGRNL